MNTEPTGPDAALAGLAAQTVLGLLPQQAQVIVRLSPAERRAVILNYLDHLKATGAVSAEEAQRLRASLMGEAAPEDSPPSAALGPLTVADTLAAAIASAPATDSFLDDLWVAAVTLWGTVVGEGIAGPVGGVIGGALAHEWAEAHPPSTWFE